MGWLDGFLCVVLVALCLWIACSTCQGSENFQAYGNCPQEYLDRVEMRLEECRHYSATYWTGQELPAWPTPCPVEVTIESHSGGGATMWTEKDPQPGGTFRLNDLKMVMEGTEQAILENVAPHEVDHAVRHSLMLNSPARWVDEGCAQLFESEAWKSQARLRVAKHIDRPIPLYLIDAKEYPRDPATLMAIYDTGLVCAEFLACTRGKQALLAFQKDPSQPTRKMVTHFGKDAKALLPEMRVWFKSHIRSDGTYKPEALNGLADPKEPEPTPAVGRVILFSATWCAPCQEQKPIAESVPGVEILDIEKHTTLARQCQVERVPCWIVMSSQGEVLSKSYGVLNRQGIDQLFTFVSKESKDENELQLQQVQGVESLPVSAVSGAVAIGAGDVPDIVTTPVPGKGSTDAPGEPQQELPWYWGLVAMVTGSVRKLLAALLESLKSKALEKVKSWVS